MSKQARMEMSAFTGPKATLAEFLEYYTGERRSLPYPYKNVPFSGMTDQKRELFLTLLSRGIFVTDVYDPYQQEGYHHKEMIEFTLLMPDVNMAEAADKFLLAASMIPTLYKLVTLPSRVCVEDSERAEILEAKREDHLNLAITAEQGQEFCHIKYMPDTYQVSSDPESDQSENAFKSNANLQCNFPDWWHRCPKKHVKLFAAELTDEPKIVSMLLELSEFFDMRQYFEASSLA